MADPAQPSVAQEQAERIQSRPYDDFARLPDDEVRRDPLATRDMRVDNRIVWPPVIVVAGFLLAFSTFVVRHWIPLVLGFVLMVVGSILSAVSRRGGRSLSPVRTSTMR